RDATVTGVQTCALPIWCRGRSFSGKFPMPRKKTAPGTPKPPSPAQPRRRPNAEVRGREHLTPAEVEALADAAGKLGRHGHRDAQIGRASCRESAERQDR